MHAEMWVERLRASDEGRARLENALEELWPYALGLLEDEQRDGLCRAVGRPPVEPVPRGGHADDWPLLWEEMTMVRRLVPGSSW